MSDTDHGSQARIEFDALTEPELKALESYGELLDRGETIPPEEFADREPNARGIVNALRAQAAVHAAARKLAGQRPPQTPAPAPIDTGWGTAALRSFPPPPIPGYEFLELIGRGGMGVVFKARQLSLKRLVAVKMILAGQFASEVDVKRFRAEAEAAAALHHPNIVAIYEIGEYAGQPFFSMEYVEGTSLAALIRDNSLPGQQAAQLVQTIAETIHYAHGKGVLHRDLKPSNVLLEQTEMGGQRAESRTTKTACNGVDLLALSSPPSALRPKITDFGLAKQIQGGPDLTGTGQILGTASYMAPEQAAGRRTDPRSDVYAIGAILYELLVGRPPFRAETAFETLRQVQELDPVTPLVLNPKMDHDLETISLKALTKDPSQRYQTAQQMAEDLGRWLNGEPIRARPIRRVEKLWRWAKRNARVAWLSAAVLALLLVVATGSPVALVGIALERRAAVAAQKQAETKAVIARSAQRQAEHNAAEALEAQRQAQKQAAIAESARRVSDEQSALALEGFSKLVYELHDLLKNQPSLRPMGEQLLDVAVQGLQKVARPTEEAARIADHATVTAQFKLADLLLILARTQEAEERLEEALRICEGSFEANPNNDQAKRDLSLAYSKRGDLCLQTGKTAVAKKYYSKVRDLQTELARDNANVCSYQRDLGIANIRLGDVSVTLGEPVAAREYFQNSLEIFQHLAAVAPADAGAQRDLSVSYERLGKLHDEQGEPAQALEYFHKSLAILDSLAVAGARDVELRRTSSVTHEKIAQASRKINDPATAEKHFTRCLELRQQLLETDPANAVAKRDLATAYEYLGALAQDRGNHEEARDHFRKSLQLREELVLADPSNAQVQRELGVIREKLGDVSLELDDVDAALQNHRMALELREELAAQDPKNVEAQRDLSISYRKLGSICARHGNYPDARQYYRKALVIREKLVAANPQSIQANLDMAATCDKFGDLEKSVQQPETALQWYERALPILRRLETEGKFQCRPQMLQWIAEIDQKRLTCSVALRAIDDIQFALEQPREIAVEALVIRAVVLARRGLHDEVMVTSEKLLHIGSADANHLYNVACCFSLCAAAVVGDKPPEHLSSDDQAIRSRYAAQAIESLTRAVELGFKDVAHMEADPDFAAIRHELGYRQLVDRLRSLFPATLD